MNNHPNQTRLGIWIGSTLLPHRQSEADHQAEKKRRRNRDRGVREAMREKRRKNTHMTEADERISVGAEISKNKSFEMSDRG